MVAITFATSAERFRAKFGFSHALVRWRDLVNYPSVEAVSIASPQHAHLAIAEAAPALGKPVLCETS